MANVFKGRSLCVIEDFSIDERRYFFKKTAELKKAILAGDEEKMDSFRINDPDFGIYEVFLEDSTRTKESFRNAAKFHHAKVSELLCDSSSINKGESYADTFNMLSGYSNRIFIVRSKVEGLTKWLSEETSEYAERNHLPYKPAFINAGDGKHEHPTQELLDEFSFLERLDMDFSEIHLALVGDLYHGRTVHSKANGLKIFNKVTVDLIAPDELMMPENYIEIMKENGFKVNIYPSIENYLDNGDIATIWYFTRPQLERMGERILKKEAELREAITFKKEFMPRLKGRIGEDFSGQSAIEKDYRSEEYIVEVQSENKVKEKNISEGVRPIKNGIVIDHICKGDSPEEIRKHIRLISSVIGLDNARGGEWISQGSDGKYKGIIFRPDVMDLSRKELKRLAAIAPHCTLNIIKDGKVAKKFRTHMPPRIYNFEDMSCKNEACISNPVNKEGVAAKFYRTNDGGYCCAYCGKVHSFKEIWNKR